MKRAPLNVAQLAQALTRASYTSTGVRPLAAKVKALLPLSINGVGREIRKLVHSPDRSGRDRRQLAGRLDTRRLVAARTARPDVFVKQWQVVGEDTAVSLLVDLSASMTGVRALMAGIAAFGIAQQLARTDAEFEVLGFSTYPMDGARTSLAEGYINPAVAPTGGELGDNSRRDLQNVVGNPLTLVEFKTWGQNLRQCENDLLVGIPAWVARYNSGTPDFEAILTATDRLVARDVQRRLLIVFTDGSGVGAEAIKFACDRAAKRNVDVIGIGICCDDARCYPHHAVVRDLSQLTGETLRKIVDVVTQERRKRGDA